MARTETLRAADDVVVTLLMNQLKMTLRITLVDENLKRPMTRIVINEASK